MHYCAHDAISYLMDSAGGGSQDQEHRVLRASVHHSYRDVCNAKDWLWHVSTGSVSVSSTDNTYVLPEDCKSVDAIVLPDRTTVTSYVTPAEWLRLEQSTLTLGEAVYWTVRKSTDPQAFDRWELCIGGRFPKTTEIQFTYRRTPKPLTLMGYETQVRTGYATILGGRRVEGTSTNFPERCVGAIFRVGTPGNYPEPLSGFYPYQGQARIKERQGDEVLLLESDIVGTHTKCRYVISDYLDVSPGMFTAVLTGAEMWAARMQGKDISAALGLYQRDLKIAMENDVIAPVSGRRAPYDRTPDAVTTQYAGTYAPLGPDQGA
jgi:hypothetical protein